MIKKVLFFMVKNTDLEIMQRVVLAMAYDIIEMSRGTFKII